MYVYVNKCAKEISKNITQLVYYINIINGWIYIYNVEQITALTRILLILQQKK